MQIENEKELRRHDKESVYAVNQHEVVGPLIVENTFTSVNLRYPASSKYYPKLFEPYTYVYTTWVEACMCVSNRYARESISASDLAKAWEKKSKEKPIDYKYV